MKYFILFVFLFTAWSMYDPWEHYLIDVVERDGLRIEADLKPQILLGIARDWRQLCISIPFVDIYIEWGDRIVKNGTRG